MFFLKVHEGSSHGRLDQRPKVQATDKHRALRNRKALVLKKRIKIMSKLCIQQVHGSVVRRLNQGRIVAHYLKHFSSDRCIVFVNRKGKIN